VAFALEKKIEYVAAPQEYADCLKRKGQSIVWGIFVAIEEAETKKMR